jgi:CheY-like chemotaxis protein
LFYDHASGLRKEVRSMIMMNVGTMTHRPFLTEYKTISLQQLTPIMQPLVLAGRPRALTLSAGLPVTPGHRASEFSEKSSENFESREPSSTNRQRSEQKTRILVVDDEQLIADTLVRILNLSGFEATAAYSGESALDLLPELCPEIVLTDVKMPGRNGIETGILIRERCPDIRVVLFSGQAGVGDVIEEARGSGHGFELWRKPIHPRELVRRLREL